MKRGDLVGAYQLARELGSGGQGIVWEARRSDSSRRFALKVFENLTTEQRERAMREARLLRSLHDSGVPEFVEVALVHHGGVAVVMEFVEGTPLTAVLGVAGITVSEKRALLVELARVLSVLHPTGIVHRDLKPANVLLRPGWERGARGGVVLVDFGIAKIDAARDGLTRQGVVMGTAPFVAPELFGGGGSVAATPSVDVFSWGVLAWLLLFGHHPTGLESTAGPTEFLVAYGMGDQRWLRPSAAEAMARGVADAALVGAAIRALREQPVQRPADGAALLDALSQWGPPTNLAMRPGGEYTHLDFGERSPVPNPAGSNSAYTRLDLGTAPTPPVASGGMPVAPQTRDLGHGTTPSTPPALILALVGGAACVVAVVVIIVAYAMASHPSTVRRAPTAAATPTGQHARLEQCGCAGDHKSLVAYCIVTNYSATSTMVSVRASASPRFYGSTSSVTVPAGGGAVSVQVPMPGSCVSPPSDCTCAL